MELSNSNNLIAWIHSTRYRLLRKLIYPGFKLGYHGVCDWFLFSLFIIPSYFGVRLAFFDLTMLRLFEVILLLCIWKKNERRITFFNMVLKCPHTFFIGLFFFIVVYTNLYHPSLGTIFYWLMNGILVFYLVAYLIITEYGVDGFLEKIRLYTWILIIISPLELIIGRAPFEFLDTLNKTTSVARFGSVRILGNCWEANSYAMYLCILLPFVCYDIKQQNINILKNKWIILLLELNIFLTGSRLTVGTSLLILGMCFIMQKKKDLGLSTLILAIFVPLLIIVLYISRNCSFTQNILRTFFSAFDEVFNTSYALSYGADINILNDSARYRDLLVQTTFFDDWLNPIIGRGGSYVFSVYIDGLLLQSVDNYYVGLYICYAWPGLIAWIIMSLSFIMRITIDWLKNRKGLSWVILSSIVGYFISLWYLDQLQTFPIMLSVFALIYTNDIFNNGVYKWKENSAKEL